MEQIIKQYLDELAEKDQLFKEKYNPEHLEWCIKYLYRQAKFIAEQTKQKSMIAIKDDTVFHWAHEYFDERINIQEEQERAAQKAREEASNKIVPEHDEEEDEDTSELETDINARIEESRRKAEEYRIQKEKEERDKREHKDGQTTIFDILGG
ncbi:Cas9 inhibitor AcrIIA9 family protein [Fibrobacter sp.]|uniref:Cas9 inhibitor AcrIIA9 family protein n=1 Tax=Fibrobacter sp. TaxID=35828 RepID=UPI0025C600B0|nr:Cas9 inhibitor AcrIIA9 family protein [Fibrobacter sp.]MBR3073617.1 hypothetical protein [Fibrobacter sp.]